MRVKTVPKTMFIHPKLVKSSEKVKKFTFGNVLKAIFWFECSARLPDGHQIHRVLSRCSDGHQNHSVLCV